MKQTPLSPIKKREYQIFIDENIPLLPDVLKKCGEISLFNGRALSKDILISQNCDVLLVRSTTIVNEHLLSGTKVKFVGTATSGIDHVDMDYLKENGITFSYAPGSNSNSVAEYVVYNILKWSFLRSIDLKNKVIGIIGYGNIGKLVAKYASQMGLIVLINDPPLKDEGFIFPEFIEYCELNDLISRSDILTNHVPLTGKTKYPTINLLDVQKIDLLKNGSLFIHTSRGGAVVEQVLLNKSDKTDLAFVIDVWCGEPLINRELVLKCMMATPHVAGYSFDGKLKGAMMLAKDFKNFYGLEPDFSILENSLSTYHPIGTDEFKNHAKLYELLKTSRLIDNDHEQLIKTLSLPEMERKKAFDLLRKDYPKRREIL